jgi:hypothetical protein
MIQYIVTRGMGGPTLITRGYGFFGFLGDILREIYRATSRIVQSIEFRSVTGGSTLCDE